MVARTVRAVLVFILLFNTFAFAYQSELSYKIQYLIGNRKSEELVKYLNSLDFSTLSPEEKADVVIGYTELYSWGGMGYSYSEKAYSLAEKMLKELPTFWKSHYAMAVVLSHRVQKNNLLALTLVGKIDDHLNLAMKNGENHWEPYFLAGVRYLEVPIFPNLDKAEMLLKKALELENKHIYTYLMIGKLYEKKKDYCRSLEIYKKGFELSIRPEWKVVDEEAKREISNRIPEVEKLCTKK
ncbi:MAG TPA: hypothetical protein DE117_07070 [Fervidobacterium sp.]|nr:hypothetical protein [Fervidobacterium sp.]HRD20028.1 hypothetical protein [Fervidobacterium sp.]